jgi:hypothetical protein
MAVRMILMCSHIHKLGEKIKKVLEDKSGYEVFYIPPEHPKKNENIFEKFINNFIFQPFLKKKLQEIKRDKEIIKEIKGFGEFELVFVIFASYHSRGVLEYLQLQKKPMYCHFWDSFSYHPQQASYLKYFQFKSSFDPIEAKTYGMKFIPNFYFENDIVEAKKIEYDAFTIMKYDERFSQLELLARFFNDNKMNYLFIVITTEKIESAYIDIRKEKIPLAQVYDYYSKSRSIVEIGHNDEKVKQGGLSFRALEALGNRKKLITNYEFIIDYDFYNQENVFVIENGNFDKINYFLSVPYKILDELIYKKYNSESWIREILLC